jgi:hypothetical protein
MGMGMTTTSTSVTVTGSIATALPAPSSSQTLINVCAATASTGDTLYTVTAGKTFYCMGLVIKDVGKNNGNVVILSDGVAKIAMACGIDAAGTNLKTTPITAGNCPIFKTAATKTVTVTHDCGAGNLGVTMWGFEQ